MQRSFGPFHLLRSPLLALDVRRSGDLFQFSTICLENVDILDLIDF